MPVIEVEFILDWLDIHKEKAPVTVDSIEMKKRHSETKSKAKERAKNNSCHIEKK
ncbi:MULTISPECIES: hypothetical protein [unclassified Pseudoalteromonas]|uniref:hypothetical protein n=1 Tax=unclassified Pseudoalteromonas TaxID=194690 RepID=UPI001F3DEC5C|nr:MULTISPECIES: hypothetical protein [unclassified Pseudoalteromonas]MCF2825920.1 hypothetical protein [Pseudoalteromonas sp. OF5H-5]MCF2834303.1 hypothetical protein [Pseudoalteromonas sp. DL2-H6]MCF2925421.1 hypothetical protein [Pseudoalteromonas sp. DL2-H1]